MQECSDLKKVPETFQKARKKQTEKKTLGKQNYGLTGCSSAVQDLKIPLLKKKINKPKIRIERFKKGHNKL